MLRFPKLFLRKIAARKKYNNEKKITHKNAVSDPSKSNTFEMNPSRLLKGGD
jgi:hypothetical protein